MCKSIFSGSCSGYQAFALRWLLSSAVLLATNHAEAQGFAQETPAPNAAKTTGTAESRNTTESTDVAASPPAARVLPIAEAIRSALERHPSLLQAQASTRLSNALVGQALAPLLPQVSGTAFYQRAALAPSNTSPGGAQSYGLWSFGVTANQIVYDFGYARGNYHVSEMNAEVAKLAEQALRLNLVLGVRNAYFSARQQKSLLVVARETLANQERHLQQIVGFMQVGTRSRIDLVQAQANRQSAELALVNAQYAYALAKAALVQAMGVETYANFEVSDESLPTVAGEAGDPRQLFALALATRPDVRAALGSVRADELAKRAIEANYGPALSLSTGLTESGSNLDQLGWGWTAQATATWKIFQGGLTRAQVSGAVANIDAANAQVNVLRQQVRLAVEQARIGVEGGKQALTTADVLVDNTRELLELAEGRYETGIGSIIELGDAQLTYTAAQQQRVQGDFNLATARAALLNAIGLQ